LYWQARRAAQPRDAETLNMFADCLVFGVWAALLGFPLWIAFILFTGATVNLTAFRGPRGTFEAAALWLLGALPVAGLDGWRVELETSAAVTVLSMVSVMYYLYVVGLGAHTRAMQLHQASQRLRQSEQALQTANAELHLKLDENRRLQERLSEQATRDPLTGLHNRRYLNATIARELARCERFAEPMSVVLIDIDHFKQINDSHGHLTGDAMLRHLVRNLRVRNSDVACRYGGDEFLLLLPGTDSAAALDWAETCRAGFARSRVEACGVALQGTVSIGVASYPAHGRTEEELFSAADRALYQAKVGGRNRVALSAAQPLVQPG
jgi:diguanylate cyclase (GGDEF)-like protein